MSLEQVGEEPAGADAVARDAERARDACSECRIAVVRDVTPSDGRLGRVELSARKRHRGASSTQRRRLEGPVRSHSGSPRRRGVRGGDLVELEQQLRPLDQQRDSPLGVLLLGTVGCALERVGCRALVSRLGEQA